MKQPFVISYDLGTSGVKVALVDLNGCIIGSTTEDYPMYTPKTNWAEQDPELYWKAVCKATKRIINETDADPNNTKGIAICSQWKGIIPIDEAGKVLHNSIIWLDARAGKQAEMLNQRFKKELFCAADYWPKLAWLRENKPTVLEQTSQILEVNSFIKWKATGVLAVDITNHYTRSYDPKIQEFYNDFMQYTDIDSKKFPKLIKTTEYVGTVTPEAAKLMGLVLDIPVFGGCNDIVAISIGSGACIRNAFNAYFGSSGWITTMVAHDSSKIYISPFDKQNDLLFYSMQSIGLSLDWTIKQLYRYEFETLGPKIFDFIEKDIADVPTGSLNMLATPWLYGERPPFFSDKARTVFLNISGKHDRRHMLNAIMESVCYTLRMGGEMLYETVGNAPEAIHAVGGGAKSDHWMQMLSDILGIPVRVPDYPQHAGAIGTAYCALIGLGLCKDFTEAAQRIRFEKTFSPRVEAHKEYKRLYEVYKQLYPLLESVFQTLN